MGVRIDEPGIRWWDYHTVGAEVQMRIAEGPTRTKPGAMLTRREYLCDASFLVALSGEAGFIEELCAALRNPKWTLYLGRKSCPPSRPVVRTGQASSLTSAPRWRRCRGGAVSRKARRRRSWIALLTGGRRRQIATRRRTRPFGTTCRSRSIRRRIGPRFVARRRLRVGPEGEVSIGETTGPKAQRLVRLVRGPIMATASTGSAANRASTSTGGCASSANRPAATVQHVTYRRAGGDETADDLRSLCRLCHDAVTMIEYGLGMGLDRINPEEPRWRDAILAKRDEIVRFRSLETRRRRLSAEEVQ